MKRLAICLCLAAPIVAGAQTTSEAVYPFRESDASPRIAMLRTAVSKNSADAAVEEFWSEMRAHGAPLVEAIPGDDKHSLVTFVWRGSAKAENVVITDGVSIGVGDADPRKSEMTRIPNTDVWYRTYDIRNDARFTYALSENDPLTSFIDPDRKSNSQADPLNPHKFLTGQTYLELPAAPPQPWVIAHAGVMSGAVENTSLSGHKLWVYTPANFQQTGEPYPLVLLMAGNAYMNFISGPATLDNLIAEKRIPPVVAVSVAGSPNDLTCSPAYADFLAKELVPWMRQKFHATADASLTVIAGSSLGGLASTFAATTHPEVFGKVLSQSGSYWWKPDNEAQGEWLTRQIAGQNQKPIRFFMEVGRMEAVELQLGSNRRMSDALMAKGYTVQYREFNGNHNYINWRGGFADGLIAFLGK
jgi:enterochelin esterase-like enzyme